MKKLLFIIILFAFKNTFSQHIIINGKVSDANSNETLPGVSIFEKGTTNGTTSNAKGEFSLIITQDSATLIFSFIGYNQQSIRIKSSQTLNISLSKQILNLNEVVVTALGIKRQKRSLGYAVQKIKSKALTNVEETNLINSLSGRVAGVQITNGSTGVGSSSHIIIRGETSLSGNNQPLFVVDGVPISNTTIANHTENIESGFQEVDYGNGAADISPDDIASITVLKGAGAAALYGSRAANGVVVIKTKEGKKNKGIGVSFNSTFSVETPLRLPKYQHVYGGGSGGQFAYENGLGAGVNDGGITSFGAAMNGQLVAQFDSPSTDQNGNAVRGGDVIARNGNPIMPTPWISQANNVKNFFKTGTTLINNITIANRSDKSNFRLSYTDLENSGIVPNTDFKRHGLAFTGGYKISKKLQARIFINYINSASGNRPSIGYGSENPMYMFTWMGRQVNTKSLKNYWQAGQKNYTQFNYNYKWMDNPYLTVFENTNSFNKNRVLGNTTLNYSFNPKLNIRFRSGLDNYHDLRASKRAYSTQRFKNGAYREDEIDFNEINTDVLLSYHQPINSKLDINLSAGANNMYQKNNYKSTTAGELSVPNVYNFENSKIPLVIQQNNAEKVINSVYAIARFAYLSKLFLDVNIRNDWSSTLPQNNNSFAYYSASLSAIISDYVALPKWITYAKLRVSAASVGNDTKPHQLNNTFNYNQNYGAYSLVTNSNKLLNPNLTPERLNALEVGGEIWFVKNRVGLDFSLYQNTGKNQIISLPTSAASGYTERLVNGGKIQSKGVELTLNLTPFVTKNFKWTSFVNFSKNASYVKKLPNGVQQYVTGFASVYESSENAVFYIASPNGKIGDMYGTGFKKINGKILYDANGLPVRDPNLRLLGNYNPDFIMGLGNQLSYKNISLNFLFDWRQGGTIVSRTKAIASTSGVLASTLKGRENGIVGDGVMNIGTSANPQYVTNTTVVSAEEYYNQFYNRANEESALYDASYVKLRQVSIAYTFNSEWLKKIGLSNLRCALIGKNLFVITQNPNFDPELTTMQGQNFAFGVEDMSLPSSRSFGISLKAKF